MINVMTGYSYKIGSMNAGTNATFCRQYGNLVRDTARDLSETNSYTLNQDLNLVIPLSFSVGINYSQSTFSKKNHDILSLSFSGTYSAFKDRWQNSLGVMYSDESHETKQIGLFPDIQGSTQ